VNAKVRKLALKRSFSDALENNAVVVVDALNLPDGKTKNFAAILSALKVDQNKLLVSVPEYEENLCRASGNLWNVFMLKFDAMNTYHILDSDKILFTKDALDAFLKRLA